MSTILQTMAEDAGTVVNSGAAATTVGVNFLGLGLPDWVAIITGGYFLLSSAFLVAKIVAWRKDRKCFEKGLLQSPPRWD